MSTERSIHEPDKQGFISSIHNYCDRRCEKCRFIRQCRVGIMEADDVDDDREPGDERVEDYEARLRKVMGVPEDDDDDNEDDGDEKKDGFDPSEFLSTEADDDGQSMEEFQREQEELRAKTKAHEASKLAQAYMDMVGEWMEPREKQLEARGVLLNKRAELRMDPGLRTPEALVLSEAIDEVGWFQHMLWVKCQRALQGKIADPEWMKEFDMDPVQSDWNGTAKLCLHIVDRCQQAWATIAELMPEEADDIEPMQEVLRRCKTELDKEFPDAEKFIRPGFDA